MTKFDLIVRQGNIITDSGALGRVDIGISNGKIVQMGEITGSGFEIDASEKLVFPGGIDPHVHLSLPPHEQAEEPRWVDDFTSGSAAALAGGITTIGNMTFPGPSETPLTSLHRESAVVREQAIADVFLHPVLEEITSEVLNEINKLLSNGCNSIKIFTVMSSFDKQINEFTQAIRYAGNNRLITLIHCEDYALIEDAVSQLTLNKKDSLRFYSESRPVISEVVATQRAVALAEATKAPVYIVHLSSARALAVCAEAQSRGVPVYVETRPLYLHLTSDCFENEDGAKYLGQPPLRTQHDVDSLWNGIQQGTIHTIGSDHAPWSLAAKLASSHTLMNLRPGVADLDTMLPMLFSEGVVKGRITLARFVQVTSTNSAKLFGLYPRKGTIAVGSDADLVIFDPNLTQTIKASSFKTKSDYSPYEGWKVTGWPNITIRRGEIVFIDGKITGHPSSGIIIPRTETMGL